MNQLLASGEAVSQRLIITECAPCAIWHQWQLRHRQAATWTGALADLVVDVASAAVMLGGAREVLVPGSLVHYVEARRAACPPTPLLHVWDTLRQDGRLVPLLDFDEVDTFVATHCASSTTSRGYGRLCVPLPAGPLASRMLFGPPMEQLYDRVLPRMRALCEPGKAQRGGATHEGDGAVPVHWRVWLRSALTCRYEGNFVAPIRVAECTARLLREGGCDAVVWEAAVAGLTPRWLETMAKTALACGVPLGVGGGGGVCLALAAGEGDRGSSTVPHLLYKAAEMGVYHFATCSLRAAATDGDVAQGSLFAHAETLCSALDVTQFAVGCNEQEQRRSVTAAEEGQLQDCAAFMRALRSTWQAHLRTTRTHAP